MMEQRLNAVVALKHILTLIPPLRSTLSKARSPLISSFVQVYFQTLTQILPFSSSSSLSRIWAQTSEIELFGSVERSNNITGRRQSFLVLDPFLPPCTSSFLPSFWKGLFAISSFHVLLLIFPSPSFEWAMLILLYGNNFGMFFLFSSCIPQELNQIDYGGLLSEIQTVVDDRAKVVKGKIGMARQRFGIIKTGVNRMLDVCRQTHNDIEVDIEGTLSFISLSLSITLK